MEESGLVLFFWGGSKIWFFTLDFFFQIAIYGLYLLPLKIPLSQGVPKLVGFRMMMMTGEAQ